MRPAGLFSHGVVNTPRARRSRASFGAISKAAARWPRRSLGACARRPQGNTSAQSSQPTRSEEHTSELQSLMRISYAVFCLKKKTKTIDNLIFTDTNKQR